MAVDAVASVILQKLRDLLSEESFTHNKVIGDQLKEMQEALEEMRGFFIDAADKESSVECIKRWTDDYLHHLYSVEDSIESFALRITRQRKRLGFLMNHALFLKKFTACKMLSRKLEKIQRKIEVLKDRRPDVLVDATPRCLRSQQSEFVDYSFGRWADENVDYENHEGGEDDDNDDDDERGKTVKEEEELDRGNLNSSVDLETDDLRSTKTHGISTSMVSVKEGGARSLLRSRSFHLREHWEQSKLRLMLCYNDLDAHLKLCLLYMMLFPKEIDIPVRRLQRLWLAEGFVKQPDNRDKFQEDVVQDYFDNLVKRSLVLVSKLRSDGSPRRCRLLGVLHDLLLDKARDISLFHVHRGPVCPEDGPFGKRRLVEYADGKKSPLKSSEFQHLRSYISFNFQKKDTPAKYVGDLVSNMVDKGLGLLRVLDLEGVYKPSLPENLGNLFHLRYLGLRWTFLDKLPKSVGELTYLETLDLKHTYINRIPPSIWRLKHLKHLSLNEIHLDKDMPLHSRYSLPKLLTLWGLSVDHESPVKNGLSKLTHLRELGISFRVNNCDVDDDNTTECSTLPQFTEDLVDWISKLTNLQSLRLRSKDDSGCPGNLSLKPFSGLTKLSHMNLLGNLQKLPDSGHFPPNIKVLTLSVSKLNEDPMPILGQLKSLTVLRLLANSYLGEKIVCPSGTFEELEVLKLWMLKDLKKWVLEKGAMKKLKELNIRCCSKLESIPIRLLQLGTFKDLILTNMPQISKENIEKNHPNVFITVKNYDFTPLPGEEVDDAPNGNAY